MSSDLWPRGFLTALLTPMRDDRIDVGRVPAMVRRQLDAGVAGVVVGGGTGEFGALDLKERRALAEAVIEAADGAVPVIIQTGALSTRDAVALTEHAQHSGAAGVMLAPPFGEAISWTERVAFYRTLDSATDLPIMLYNTDAAGLMKLSQIAELAELRHVSAVKDSSGDAMVSGDIARWAGANDFVAYVGIDSLLVDGLVSGAHGAVLGTGNLIPRVLSELVDDVLEAGANSGVVQRWKTIRPMLRFVETSDNYVALVKAASDLTGLNVGDVRPPFVVPSQSVLNDLAPLLAAAEQLGRIAA